MLADCRLPFRGNRAIRKALEPQTGEFLEGRQVYLDTNDNGVFDAGVDPLAPPTSATGDYFFTGLGTIDYVVRVITGPGESTSTPLGNEFNTLHRKARCKPDS